MSLGERKMECLLFITFLVLTRVRISIGKKRPQDQTNIPPNNSDTNLRC